MSEAGKVPYPKNQRLSGHSLLFHVPHVTSGVQSWLRVFKAYLLSRQTLLYSGDSASIKAEQKRSSRCRSSLVTSIKEVLDPCLAEARGTRFCSVPEQYNTRPGEQFVPKLRGISSLWKRGNVLIEWKWSPGHQAVQSPCLAAVWETRPNSGLRLTSVQSHRERAKPVLRSWSLNYLSDRQWLKSSLLILFVILKILFISAHIHLNCWIKLFGLMGYNTVNLCLIFFLPHKWMVFQIFVLRK